MKKYFISGVLAIAISAVFTGCSKSTDLYDEGAIEQNKEAQKEQKIAQLREAYNQAFVKEFGTIAPGHKWGFDKCFTTPTRGEVYTTSFEGYIMPEVIGNNIGKDFDTPFNAASVTSLPDFISSGNYVLQHVFKQVNNGNGHGGGNNDQHHQMAQLQAYDFNAGGGWIDVTYFDGGKDVHHLVDNFNNQYSKGCTIMTGMGTPVEGQPVFRWVYSDNANNNQEVCTNYVIKKVGDSYYLGMGYSAENTTDYDAWIIKLLPAEVVPPTTSRGRVFCEDLGEGGDIDFNDVVFDADVFEDGRVEIRILAAGGILPIYVAGERVTVGKMAFTGVNGGSKQTISLSAERANELGIHSVADIPVFVEIDGDLVEIVNIDGKAPGKIFTYINVPWADEYVNIGAAYPNFRTYVNSSTPSDWFIDRNEILTDLDLTNNN